MRPPLRHGQRRGRRTPGMIAVLNITAKDYGHIVALRIKALAISAISFLVMISSFMMNDHPLAARGKGMCGQRRFHLKMTRVCPAPHEAVALAVAPHGARVLLCRGGREAGHRLPSASSSKISVSASCRLVMAVNRHGELPAHIHQAHRHFHSAGPCERSPVISTTHDVETQQHQHDRRRHGSAGSR